MLLYQLKDTVEDCRSKCAAVCRCNIVSISVFQQSTEGRLQHSRLQLNTGQCRKDGEGTSIYCGYTHCWAHIDSLHCSIHNCGYTAISLWHSMRASHIHPHMSHLLKRWSLLTEQICCRKSTTNPEISQLHLCALLQGTSVVRDVKCFMIAIYLPAANALPGLGTPPPPPARTAVC